MLEPITTLEQVPSVDDLVTTMDTAVAGLDKFKKRLALILRRHLIAGVLDRVVHPPNLLVIGPSGGGKTHTLRTILDSLPAPWVQGAATAYTDAGYTGTHLPSLYAQLLAEPKWRAERKRADLVPIIERFGIVVLDEFDKLRLIPGADERSMARNRALQAELLTITEGTVIQAKHDDDGNAGAPLRTHGILHIAVGAFEGLNRAVAISNEHQTVAENAYEGASLEDLTRFGFLEELIGRFSMVLTLPPLSVEHLVMILNEHIIPKFEQQLDDDGGKKLVVDPIAKQRLAERAKANMVGARSLDSDLDDHIWEAWTAAPPGATIHLTPQQINMEGAAVEEFVDDHELAEVG